MNGKILLTNADLCVGCNKCIAACCVKANLAFQSNGQNKVKVDQRRCIHCGECIEVCDHNVRYFADDTDRFFFDLKQGLNISVIAAPATQFNFPHYKRLFSYLKSLGVGKIYDVSFGADITTWAYLKAIKERNLDSIIAQSCPVIVNYIQKYRPEIIGKLAPIHSPMMCTAIYLKQYKGLKDQLAFLSPCIGKIDEINESNTGGFVTYNVTFAKLERYLEQHGINLSNYAESDYNFIGHDPGLGVLFSRPGGLRENVESYTDKAWVRQIEGPQHVYDYLDEYAIRVHERKQVPLIIDILNCRHGCNLGTGTNKSIAIDDIDAKMNGLKRDKIRKEEPLKKIDLLENFFESKIRLSDFERRYKNKSHQINSIEEVEHLEHVFLQLHKTTQASRKINCYSCGYGSCTEFAKAVVQGANHLGNCIDYNRKELVNNKEHLSQTNKEVAQLHYLATHDFLTNIPNRYYLENYLKQLINTETIEKSESALIFIDIDNFKVVNDLFGHASGDEILIKVVNRLQRTLNQEAVLTRLSGDEFAVVLKDTNLDKAKDVANQLLQALRFKEFKINNCQGAGINVTASFGIAMIDGAVNPQEVFSCADIALYSAKENGKNRIITVRTGEDKAKLLESNKIILKINDALKENRLILYFQPVVKTDNTIIHYEALVRMFGQDGELVFPNEFLPIAERFGLISQIDRWVVNAGIKFLYEHPAVSIFVNLSGSSLGDVELLNYIETRINNSNIQPSRIGFEITETAVIRDLDQVEKWISRIRSIGCKFALDDFGVGFSSFTHLQRIPVDYVKIDGSFIRNLDVDFTQKALVQAMNDVAHAVGKETIAEYVESEKIWAILRELKIDYGQGYFLGKPAPFS